MLPFFPPSDRSVGPDGHHERFAFPREEDTPMDASVNAGLLRRLEQLERSNRRLKILAVVVLLGLGGIGVMGQARPPAQIVEAQEFIVKDANGNVRARLGAYAAGASLTLYHDAGRATLMASGGRGPGA